MANKDFKVKNGLDIQTPLPVSMGGTGQTSTTNTLNSLLPAQAGNTNKVLQTDGTNTQWYTVPAAYTRGGTASRPVSPTAGDLYYNTDYNYFESYTANGWFPIAAAPLAPTGVTATNQPTGRAFNNGQMSVAFTPNTSGGAPTSFIVTPSPSTSPSTFTGSSSPVIATGLTSSTQYTYTVQATSPYGTSSASSASSGVTATTVPQAPTIGTATAGSAQADITFTAGATGGSSITSYTVTSNPGNITASAASSPITITGLTNDTAYTFTVTATNANGTSSASSASNSVTPTAYLLPTSYEPIAITTVPAGGLSSITFGSIPQTYTHLQLRIIARSTIADTNDFIMAKFNSDTGANYSYHYLRGDGTSASSLGSGFGSSDYFRNVGFVSGANSVADVFGISVVDIFDYANTNKLKTIRTLTGKDENSNNANGRIFLSSMLWNSTNAISTITLTSQANIAPYSSFALYGIKGV